MVIYRLLYPISINGMLALDVVLVFIKISYKIFDFRFGVIRVKRVLLLRQSLLVAHTFVFFYCAYLALRRDVSKQSADR